MENLTKDDKQNRRKGIIFSSTFHTVVIILAALFGFTFQDPPPEPPGVTVALGIPDVGQGDEAAPPSEPSPAVSEPEPVEEEPEPVVEKPKVEKPTPDPPKKTVEDPEAAAIKKQKEEAKKQQQEEAKQKAAEDAKKKAEAARKKAEADAEAKRQADLKAGIEGALGSGKGKNNKPGNEGREDGDPDGKALEGLGGNGDFGGGLGKRNIVSRPAKLQHATQVTCVVYVNVCADASGSVTGTEIVFSKSSCTEDSALLTKVKANAKGFRFNKSSASKQCGEIAYRIN